MKNKAIHVNSSRNKNRKVFYAISVGSYWSSSSPYIKLKLNQEEVDSLVKQLKDKKIENG